MSAIAAELREALAEELRDLLGEGWSGTVRVEEPERGAAAGEAFRISIAQADRRTLEAELPCGLALGYLGDEENAVDVWKSWTEELAERIRTAGAAT
ncbi:MAG TPA: hypothetical protein VGB99_12620 [Acidobacteriota bacterium]